MSQMVRYRVVFRGRVQGVGFRYTSRDVAGRFAVSGYVRNLPDGTVELVAEGDRVELDRFLRELCEVMGRYIREREVGESGATGEFEGFGIRH